MFSAKLKDLTKQPLPQSLSLVRRGTQGEVGKVT